LLARGQRLTVEESDRLSRVAHIIAMIQTLFGDDEKAKHSLSKSKDCFSGKSPIAMLFAGKPVVYLAGTPSAPS
jgi:uncharacterized protein (DUF2384 family)